MRPDVREGPKKNANVAMLAAVAFLFASVCFGLFVVLGWVRSVLVVCGSVLVVFLGLLLLLILC